MVISGVSRVVEPHKQKKGN